MLGRLELIHCHEPINKTGFCVPGMASLPELQVPDSLSRLQLCSSAALQISIHSNVALMLGASVCFISADLLGSRFRF